MSSASCFFSCSFLPEFFFRFPLVCRVPHLPSTSLPTFLLSASPPLPLLCHKERVSINPGRSSWSSCECLLGGLEENLIKFQSSSPLAPSFTVTQSVLFLTKPSRALRTSATSLHLRGFISHYVVFFFFCLFSSPSRSSTSIRPTRPLR